MRVYKFYPARWALEALDRRRLKLTTLADINDPFEYGALVADNDAERAALKRAKEKTLDDKGIVSLSKTWGSPLLWSHYADSHRGIALGLDVKDGLLTEITYEKERPKLRDYLLPSGGIDPRIEDQLTRVKADQWSYEQEVRLVAGLPDPDRVNGLYFIDFDNDVKLAEVILGVGYVSQNRTVWTDELTRQGVAVRTAEMSSRRFEMVEQKDTRLLKAL